jgi:hypothetical protein
MINAMTQNATAFDSRELFKSSQIFEVERESLTKWAHPLLLSSVVTDTLSKNDKAE